MCPKTDIVLTLYGQSNPIEIVETFTTFINYVKKNFGVH